MKVIERKSRRKRSSVNKFKINQAKLTGVLSEPVTIAHTDVMICEICFEVDSIHTEKENCGRIEKKLHWE